MDRHPHAAHRQHKVERSRVAHITKGYASGGAVRCDEPEERKRGGKIEKHVREPEGKKAKRRADRVTRAKGGRVGHKKGATHVNVIVNGGDKGAMPVPMPPPAMAGPPPMPAGPVAGVGGPPPGAGGPPGMPPMPGRASGGKVKSGPAWVEGIKAGTQVSHRAGKATTNTPENLDRGRPVTFKSGGMVKSFYARGGAVEANGKSGKQMGPKLPGGVMAGETRIAQARRPKNRADGGGVTDDAAEDARHQATSERTTR